MVEYTTESKYNFLINHIQSINTTFVPLSYVVFMDIVSAYDIKRVQIFDDNMDSNDISMCSVDGTVEDTIFICCGVYKNANINMKNLVLDFNNFYDFLTSITLRKSILDNFINQKKFNIAEIKKREILNKIRDNDDEINCLEEEIEDLEDTIESKKKKIEWFVNKTIELKNRKLLDIMDIIDKLNSFEHNVVSIKFDKALNNIFFNFGDIYMTEKVSKGKKMVGEVETLDIAPARIYIGNMTVLVKNLQDIRILNNKPVIKSSNGGLYTHPHAHPTGICVGSGTPLQNILNLLLDGDINGFINKMYNILISYNKESPYCKIQEFYTIRGESQ